MRLAFQPKASLIVVLPQWCNGYGLCSRWRLSAVQLCRAVIPFLCPFSFSLVMDIRSFLEFMLFNLISWCWRLTRIQISLSIEMLSNLNLQIAFISSALIEV